MKRIEVKNEIYKGAGKYVAAVLENIESGSREVIALAHYENDAAYDTVASSLYDSVAAQETDDTNIIITHGVCSGGEFCYGLTNAERKEMNRNQGAV